MAKLLEKNGSEMLSALVALATPIRNFVEDDKFMKTFRDCTKKGVRSRMEGILVIYADLVPLLFGEKHMKDTMTILATVEGMTVKQMLEMDGTEMLSDALKAWNEQIKPFFTRLGLSE